MRGRLLSLSLSLVLACSDGEKSDETTSSTVEDQDTGELDYDNDGYADLLTTLDAPGHARLHSCGGPFAAAWQWASPAKPGETLEYDDYSLTARALSAASRSSAYSFKYNRTRTSAMRNSPVTHTRCSQVKSENRCEFVPCLVR